mmetsp:Transcript_65441/g.212036  ORF Transcript_65441/g.212036 Transcript_65441/m.212036 type:complete len:268 (+) Transcript_65441:410-1213(+)
MAASARARLLLVVVRLCVLVPLFRLLPRDHLSVLPLFLPRHRLRLFGRGAHPVADALPIFDACLQIFMQRVEGRVVGLAVATMPVVHRRAGLYGVVCDEPATRMHQMQLLQLLQILVEGRATLVHEDHIQAQLAKLLAQPGNQVLDLPDPYLGNVGEPRDVRDMPRNASVDGVDLEGADTWRALQAGVLEEDGAIGVALGIGDLHLPAHAARGVADEGAELDHRLVLGHRSADDRVPKDLGLVVAGDLEPLPLALREAVDLLQHPLR